MCDILLEIRDLLLLRREEHWTDSTWDSKARDRIENAVAKIWQMYETDSPEPLQLDANLLICRTSEEGNCIRRDAFRAHLDILIAAYTQSITR